MKSIHYNITIQNLNFANKDPSETSLLECIITTNLNNNLYSLD